MHGLLGPVQQDRANRHKTLRRVLGELLPSHPMVTSSGFAVPQLPDYSAWVDNPDSVLSGHGLKRVIAGATGRAREELELAAAWNDRVNKCNEQMTAGISPFALVQSASKGCTAGPT